MTINVPHRLMQGLLYPAALGAGIAAFLYRILGTQTASVALHDVRNGFAVLLAGYYSIAFLANEYAANRYRWRHFYVDLAEVILITYTFGALGLFDLTGPSEPLQGVYVCLIVLPLLHLARHGHISPRLTVLLMARLVIAGVGAAVGYRSDAFNAVACVLLLVLTAWYFRTRFSQFV